MRKIDGLAQNRRRAQSVRGIVGMTDVRATLTTLICAVTLGIMLAGYAHTQPGPKLPVIGILATGQLRTSPPYPALERALRDLGLVDYFELVVNMKTAKSMGVTMPPSVLLRADRVIE